MKSIIGCTLLILSLASCTVPSPQSRIAKSGSTYSLLSPEHRRLVARGEITEGMSKDAVLLAWGKPSKTYDVEEGGNTKERWVYSRSQPRYSTSIGLGYGGFPRNRRYGYYGGVDYGPRTLYMPEQVGEVIFRRDKVESWERKK